METINGELKTVFLLQGDKPLIDVYTIRHTCEM